MPPDSNGTGALPWAVGTGLVPVRAWGNEGTLQQPANASYHLGMGVVLANAAGVAVFIVGMIGAVIVGIIIAAKAKKKRQMALEAWARRHGLHYTPDEVSTLENRFGHFGDFTQGDNRYGYNVMRGEIDGRDVWAFDYHYQTYSHTKNGRQTHHHHFSAVVLHSNLGLRPLRIRQENFLDKISGAIGFDDIDFESAQFSREFHVKADSKRWAYDVIHQETMEFLLEAPRFTLEFGGPWVLARRRGRFKPPEFDDALEVAKGIIERIPRDLAADLRL